MFRTPGSKVVKLPTHQDETGDFMGHGNTLPAGGGGPVRMEEGELRWQKGGRIPPQHEMGDFEVTSKRNVSGKRRIGR